jgi:hypothetical protein
LVDGVTRRDRIEQALAKFGSTSMAMRATGCTYEQVTDVIAGKTPKVEKPQRYDISKHHCTVHVEGSRTCFIQCRCGCQECTAASSIRRAFDQKLRDRARRAT